MNKLMTLLACGCLALSISGCTWLQPKSPRSPLPSQVTTGNIVSAAEVTDSAATMHAITLSPVNETVTAADDSPLFTLSFQEMQLVLPDAKPSQKILEHLHTQIEAFKSYGTQIMAQAQMDYSVQEYWSEYFVDISYTPTRLDETVLSLFGNISSYSGGAHPSLITDSVSYDLRTGDIIYLDDILSPECTSDQLYQMVLKSLESQADNLYYDYADALGNTFTGELHCIQDWYFSQSGLCFHFAPYDIAPYSSGTIIAELPYSTLKDILNEKYLPIVSQTAAGSIYIRNYNEEEAGRFSFIAEASLCENGSEVLLYSDAPVTDLRIETGYYYPDNNQYVAVNTVFAADTVNIGDAIHLTANIKNQETVLRLVYHADQKEYSAFIAYDIGTDSVQLKNANEV